MQIKLSKAEAVFTASAIQASIARMTKHCQDTDAQFGKLNDIYRDHIKVLEGAYKTFKAKCLEEGITLQPEEE